MGVGTKSASFNMLIKKTQANYVTAFLTDPDASLSIKLPYYYLNDNGIVIIIIGSKANKRIMEGR